MNKNALAWVEALESGKFKKGIGKLTTISDRGIVRYCCLGVACELYRRVHPRMKVTEESVNKTYRTYAREANILPKSVQKWLELSSCQGSYSIGTGVTDLVMNNDIEKLSFKKIAAIIRSDPEGLFVSRGKNKTG